MTIVSMDVIYKTEKYGINVITFEMLQEKELFNN